MSRLTTIDPNTATGEAETLLNNVQAKMGMVPNMTRTMANSPAVLDAYLSFSGALAQASIDAQLREKIALLSAQENGCGYCLSAHTAIGKMVGVPAEERDASRRGASKDARHDAALRFARAFLDTKGKVSDEALATIRAAEFSDAEIAEIGALVAENIFTNYFNRLAQPEVDFPEVEL